MLGTCTNLPTFFAAHFPAAKTSAKHSSCRNLTEETIWHPATVKMKRPSVSQTQNSPSFSFVPVLLDLPPNGDCQFFGHFLFISNLLLSFGGERITMWSLGSCRRCFLRQLKNRKVQLHLETARTRIAWHYKVRTTVHIV